MAEFTVDIRTRVIVEAESEKEACLRADDEYTRWLEKYGDHLKLEIDDWRPVRVR